MLVHLRSLERLNAMLIQQNCSFFMDCLLTWYHLTDIIFVRISFFTRFSACNCVQLMSSICMQPCIALFETWLLTGVITIFYLFWTGMLCMNWGFPRGNLTRNVQELLVRLYSIYIVFDSLDILILQSLPEFSFCFACFNCRCLVNSILMETPLCTIRWFEWHRYFSNLNDFIIDWIGSLPSKKHVFKILIIQKQIIIDFKKLLFVDFMNSVYYQYPWV